MLEVHVRMRVEELAAIAPTHLFSEIETDLRGSLFDPPLLPVKGITEWTVKGPRELTLGWDWIYEPASSRFNGLWSSLCTNLMVVDEDDADMGIDCLRLCVAKLVTRARWEATVAIALHLQPRH